MRASREQGRSRRFLGWVLVLAVSSLIACREDRRQPSGGMAASGMSVPAGPSAVTLDEPEPPQYPLVFVAPPEVQAAAAEAKAESDAMDAACAQLSISESLEDRRPGHTGCPRPVGPPPSWGAR